MNETIIEFDNKKRLKLALFGLLMTIAALAFAYYIFFVAEKIRIFPGALMLTLGGYIQQLAPQEQQHVLDNGLAISADQLSLHFNELKKLIEEYYEWYKRQ
ncbi:MAG: hypothetical protein ACN6O7_08600 [Sphingobacterium sp.]